MTRVSFPLVREQLWRAFDELDVNRTFVGFNDFFESMIEQLDNVTYKANVGGYPPYNIRSRDDGYTIELAVAGFGQSDIKIEQEEQRLIITGSKQTEEGSDYCYQGLAGRDFTRSFVLADNVEVTNANLVDGLLTITLTKNEPEVKRKVIELASEKMLLQED